VLYPKNIEIKLSFDAMREMVKERCLSAGGAWNMEQVKFSSDFTLVSLWLKQGNEMKNLLGGDQALPLDHIFDLRQALKKAETAGAYFLEEELFQLYLNLVTVKNISQYFEKRKESYPSLSQVTGGLIVPEKVFREIDMVLDKEGNMKKNASRELSEIIGAIQEKETLVRKRINQIYKKAEAENWLAGTGITIRDGRMVLPVLSEHKRKIKGITHDESATGQTLFIEPEEVLELNNDLRELQLEKRREVIRILLRVTDTLRPHIHEIKDWSRRIGLIDFIRAKTLLAIELNAGMPMLKNQPGFRWRNAYHPILFYGHKDDDKVIVPLSLSLDREQRICVISGPNAGGKSVSLKTIGLLQYMLQCGFLIPVDPDSEAGIFDDIFIDIGDEQSIENDLSTYSSHLKSMKHFVNFSSKKTLFLIDELCTGTDPQFGGPIGEAVLNELNNNQSFGVVTSHFSNIKSFANNTPHVFNASMSFDTTTLQPLYQLQVGHPGSSYAMEIAQKIGLNKTVLQYARNKLDKKQQRVEQLLVELEKERIELGKKLQESTHNESELKRAIDENQRLNKELAQNKKNLLRESQAEAKALIENTNRLIENIIREIRETSAEKENTNKLRKKLKDDFKVLEEKLQLNTTALDENNEELKVGDHVKMKDKTVVGQVIKINNKKATVAFENIYSIVPVSELVKAGKPKQDIKNAAIDLSLKATTFNTTLDVRGARGEEAMVEVEKFIDDALLLSADKLRIIHGKGDGILRKLIWSLLKKHSAVATYEYEKEEFGGTGATVVVLK
jgi:DNA mismatch repair protein MutS2